MMLRRAPDVLESGQNIASLASEAADNQTVGDERTDAPEDFTGARHGAGHIAKVVFAGAPGSGVQADATYIKRRGVPIGTHSRKGRDIPHGGTQADIFGGDFAALVGHACSHFELFVGEEFAARFSAGGENFPPE